MHRQRLRLHRSANTWQVIERLNQAEGIAAYELNVSCPNVHAGGMAFGADPGALEYLVNRAKGSASQAARSSSSSRPTSPPSPTWPKSPRDAGADAISLTNTFLAMAIDAETRRPAFQCHRRPLRAGHQAHRPAHGLRNSPRRPIPILGMGGIVTAEDAVEFLLAGATAVQVGTASYADPRAVERLAKGLEVLVPQP
jgi:dihydroorotate dehydrogenase (NAD+) catalytic subunit